MLRNTILKGGIWKILEERGNMPNILIIRLKTTLKKQTKYTTYQAKKKNIFSWTDNFAKTFFPGLIILLATEGLFILFDLPHGVKKFQIYITYKCQVYRSFVTEKIKIIVLLCSSILKAASGKLYRTVDRLLTSN